MQDEYTFTPYLWGILKANYGQRAGLFFASARDGGAAVLSIGIMRE